MQYTNFERIKNMSVEELAEFIYSGNECGFCNQFGIDTGRKCDGDCVECIKHWLGLKTPNNFYAVGSGYVVTEKADFYENAILASAGL